MQVFQYDKLRVQRYENRAAAGKEAGEWAAMKINELLKTHETINVLFAAAPSQDEMLASFMACDVDFSRINALHMDEYIGLADDAPQRFGHYLDEHAFKLANFRSVFYVACGADGETTCDRYEKLVAEYPIDVAFIGIGENGHIAFNDPHEAKFDDPQNVRIVTLDDVCRQQQVNDGCFPTINDVPKTAITLTIPAIMHAKTLVCTVPAKAKANAVKAACLGPVSEACPASIIRTHDDCVLFCDPDSGCYLG